MNIIKLDDLNAKLGSSFNMNILDELSKLKNVGYTTLVIKDDKLKNKIKSTVRFEGWSQKTLTLIECPVRISDKLSQMLDMAIDIDSKIYVFIPMKLEDLILEMSRLERLKAFL